MKKLRNNKGVTLVSLAVTIVVMMILAVGVTMSTTSTIELKKYNAIKQDIIVLSEEVKTYYLKYEKLPVYSDSKVSLNHVPNEDKNPNDNGNYYAINISDLPSGTSINRGEGNKKKDFNSKDLYVVNEESLTVYYVDGAVLDGKKHYTIVDAFEGGSFATAYYSKVDLPIISVVTMESNGKDKSLACTGDTLTLKILSNYNFTTLPTVQINNENVAVTWNGKVGTAIYKLPYVESATEYNKEIQLKISGYTADGRSGEEITKVNFGSMVYRYAETIFEAFNRGTLKIGDYVTYTPSNTSATYTSVTNENGWADQTYSVDTSTQWRILGVDDSKKTVTLIAADPIKKDMNLNSKNDYDKTPYLYMKGAYSYVNCETMLENICKIYSNNYGTARSITIDDINNVLGVKVDLEGKKVYFENDPDKNIDRMGVLGNTFTFLDRNYTPESYINNKTYVTAGTKTKPADAYYYDYTDLISRAIGNTTIGNLLFDGTLPADKFVKSYWLASRGVFANSGQAVFGTGVVSYWNVNKAANMFDNYCYCHARGYAVRPVVELRYDVTISDVPKAEKQENNQDWSSYDNSNPVVGKGYDI